eukprot:TRINITY_DN10264_c0_g1_i1.p1 TRINITY_DN10264_c0_g1~~TRINITY_DN10264_c0_g1_i1.p1  ORF type:complete len:344 (-),score=61.20 TRINITY_DN10264_c0_g1_i1:79-1110(-)
MSKDEKRIKKIRGEIDDIKKQISKIKKANHDIDGLKEYMATRTPKRGIPVKPRRTLKGHQGKIMAMEWANIGESIISAATDGNLLGWDPTTGNKTFIVPLSNTWVMTCAYAPDGNIVATAGMENICSVYNLRSAPPMRPVRQLVKHDAYISCAKFMSQTSILTSSGDGLCILWDLEDTDITTEFRGHNSDVMGLDVNPSKDVFISGSCDETCKLWDIRTGSMEIDFTGAGSEINTIKYFPDYMSFATGNDNGECVLYDIRTTRELNRYSPGAYTPATSVAFSLSGAYLFVGYDDYSIQAYHTLSGEIEYTLEGHEDRVSSVGVNQEGTALASGSWDGCIKVWA